MEINLKTGLSAKFEGIVEYKDTAKFIGSGLPEVFSTPSMITLMENAAYMTVKKSLPNEFSTVGTSVDAQHIAATPVGLKVWAEAVLTEIDGRRLTFKITAHNEKEIIGQAMHDRFIVEVDKFTQKANTKV